MPDRGRIERGLALEDQVVASTGGRKRPGSGLSQYLFDRIRFTDSCWIWTGSLGRCGYGLAYYEGLRMQASRAVWISLRGEISANLELDHHCENPVCVNPEHLEPVTHQVNCERRSAKQTHCKRGHPLDGLQRCSDGKGNVWIGRYCRTCCRERKKREYDAKKR